MDNRPTITCNCGHKFQSAYDIPVDDPFNIVHGNTETCPRCHAVVASANNLASSRDFKFSETSKFGREYRAYIAAEPLADVYHAFVGNMDRVLSLSFLPWWLLATHEEFLRLRRTVFEDLSKTSSNPPFWEVRKEVSRRMAEKAAWTPHTERDLTEIDPMPVDIGNLANWRGTEGTMLAIESVLASMLIGAWTAFETIAGDLWERVVNMRPALGYRVIGAEMLTSDGEQAIEKKRKLKFTLPVGIAVDAGLDFSEKMGTLLAATKGWEFSRRRDIADAYLTAFEDDHAQLKVVLDDPRLRWLAAARNILVHRGGIADRPFTKAVGDHRTFKLVGENKPVPIDGSVVRELVDGASECGISLLKFADGWLIANPGV